MAADALLSTKLQIPAARPDVVARPRLVSQLAEGSRLGRRLALVSAPPGFGKTTLIREWAGACGRRVAWLSLDESDNDPRCFLRYLRAALNLADEQVGRGLLPSFEFDSPRIPLVALINELAETPAERLLVLDDYHLIHNFATHDLVTFFLANQPPGLQVVIGTREDPPLPLARMRARDQVTEVREFALRFTGDEAAAFLTRTMHLDLSAAAVASLTSRTEGWITGLQLAGVALRQQSSADAFVAAFAGDDSYIVDYLMAEVLDRAPESVRGFLRQTAILDRLSASLCNALTGRDDSQAQLEQLESANLFLVRLDNHREWYRYHVLFAEVLRLTLSAPERADLHRRAARWFQVNGWDQLAMHHAGLATGLSGNAGAGRHHPAEQPLVEPLSEREIEVLRLIAEGCSNAEIGRRLYIAGGTVKRHINNIFGKLGVESRTQAVAKSRALGLLE